MAVLEFAIRPMTAADASAIATWRYPGEYSFYDADADPADLAELLDPAEWGQRYFAADELAGHTLAGQLVVKLTGPAAEIGLGLRPDLTGRGLGEPFLRACLNFASATLGAQSYTLAVAAFNRRAITVYQRAGFQEVDRFEHFTNGGGTPSSGWPGARSRVIHDLAACRTADIAKLPRAPARTSPVPACGPACSTSPAPPRRHP